MSVYVRKQIIDYITASGPSTEAELVTECLANGIRERRVNRVLERMVNNGVLSESGGDYSLV